MSTTEQKILRVGVLQSGKIVEERLLRKREAVTIGTSPKNTFYLPTSKLPQQITLLDIRNEKYLLGLRTDVDGKVSIGDQLRTLEELQASQGAIVGKDGVKFVPLDEKARGKLVLGDITVLFQFVTPPPISAKPTLPAGARGGFAGRLRSEWAFLTAVIASIAIQAGVIAASYVIHPTKARPPKKDYLAQLKIDVDFEKDKPKEAVEEPEKPKELEEPSPEDIVDAPPTVNEPPPPEIPRQREPEKRPNPLVAKANSPTPRDPGRAQPPKGAEEIAKRRSAVVDKTVLKALMGSGEAGPGDVGINQGAAAKYATAFEYDGKNPTAMNAPEEKAFGGGPAAGEGGAGGPKAQTITAEERKQAGIGQALKTDVVAKVPTKAPTEKKVEAKINLAGGAKKGGGLGKLDTAQVSSVFKRRATAFRACYESRLQDKPSLAGKIVIRFTIGGAGRVTNIDVASNTTGDTAVGACIVEKVRGMKFDKPENGDVSFTYPIVLSKGN